MLAVLWMLGGGAVLAMLLLLSARDALGIASNRTALATARWTAEGCVERARAAVDEWTGDAIDDSTWIHLDRVILGSPLTHGCRLSVSPAGMTLDVNSASDATLRRLFVEAGLSLASADSLASAILDWRDGDDDPRGNGAERAWYDAAGRAPPRNAEVASREELAEVRGLDVRAWRDSLLGTDHERIFLGRAPRAVLATLPGITAAALAEIDRRRSVGDSAIELGRIAAFVDSAARETLLANAGEVASRATALPDAWLIASEGSAGHPAVTTRLEFRVVRSGRRLAIMRRRSDT
jgi:hypothetical protein